MSNLTAYERLQFIYAGAQTKRYHTADTLTDQTVGAHSFGVAWLVVALLPNASRHLLLAAMSHDLAEHRVGDVSSPTKRKYPALKHLVDTAESELLDYYGLNYEAELTTEERRVLKLADNMDGMMFCVRERKMGSRAVCPIYENYFTYTNELFIGEVLHDNAAYDLFNDINNAWEKYDV